MCAKLGTLLRDESLNNSLDCGQKNYYNSIIYFFSMFIKIYYC